MNVFYIIYCIEMLFMFVILFAFQSNSSMVIKLFILASFKVIKNKEEVEIFLF